MVYTGGDVHKIIITFTSRRRPHRLFSYHSIYEKRSKIKVPTRKPADRIIIDSAAASPLAAATAAAAASVAAREASPTAVTATATASLAASAAAAPTATMAREMQLGYLAVVVAGRLATRSLDISQHGVATNSSLC